MTLAPFTHPFTASLSVETFTVGVDPHGHSLGEREQPFTHPFTTLTRSPLHVPTPLLIGGGTGDSRSTNDESVGGRTVKTYRQHRCSAHHRTHRTAARCIFRRAAWILGDGPFAVIAWCNVPTISLHSNPDAARGALETVNATGCGGRCQHRHDLVLIALDKLVKA